MSETHPEPAELAALDEDLLTPSETAGLRAHLARCAACAATLDELTALRRTLHEETDPGPIPEDVVFRIDAALAAEAARPDARPAAVVSRETARSSRRYARARLALAAAGAALAVGIGAVVLEALGSAGGSDAGGSMADAPADEDGALRAPEPPVESLEGQVRELLENSHSPEAPEEQETSPEQEPLPETQPPTSPPSPTSAPSEEPTEGATEDPGSGEMHTLSDMPTCVDEAIGRPEEPLAVNEEDYNGTDAYLVVFPHSEDPELVTAYVVDAQCVSATPPVTGEILLEESYPRE
ncbi:hypothetical protein FH609_021295 [Streptomyces sp. 3MP-14]|uniref:Zinc-finger domain-containing protein n=1 Tax=Streptomyces mimosae TaxID=2586635 RepID=A0A5N6A7B2_9ACTN|nr:MULTISPECIES: hypothetical protein [Streptomyces]KAB8163338.1 hypothetical protein FH607_018710 [Streptomyces mimosae]KAB8174615.1 hypothetical protein FH609_021295 [Streptomyces sp. 3MP-14]